MDSILQHDRLAAASKILLAPIILLMLFIGLQNRGYDPTNHLSTDPERGGLTFARNALAFTEPGFNLPRGPDGFSIEMTIEPDYQPYPSFEILLQIVGNSLKKQLLIGQWGQTLVVMNGDDYSHKRREPKIYVPLDEAKKKFSVRITSGRQGTSVFINGGLAGHHGSFALAPPPGNRNRLLLGNSISAQNPWYGTLYAVSFHAAGEVKPSLQYTFNVGPLKDSVQEQKSRGPEILLPPKIPILQKRILLWPNLRVVTRPLLIFDITINLLGFIPLGILLPIYLQSTHLLQRKTSMVLSLFIIVALSLFIEISQIWIPARYSSLLDLLLNSSGGLAGIIIAQRLFNRPHSREP